MNKENEKRLKRAIDFIDSMSSDEFESFLIECSPNHEQIDTDFSEINIENEFFIVEMDACKCVNDCFYDDDISLAA